MRHSTLTLDEVEQVLEWAALEGWNPGLDDGAAFFNTDPNGFLGVYDNARLTAAISVVKLDSVYGFLGLYICHPDYRGKGMGLSVWNAGMEYLNGMTIGLDGVLEQQPNYQRSGFEFAYRNIRYQGILNSSYSDRTDHPDYQCRPLELSDMPTIRELDYSVHGFNRHSFIDHWVKGSKTRKSLVCLQHNEVVGFGSVRQCREGLKIGPLIAPSLDVAQVLLFALANLFSENEIVLDVPEPNKHAVSLAQNAGLKPVFETARMYRGDAPGYQLENLFGVTTFELG